jgi:LDH2 family malate/lactate/ureidoglycolate dehydrogenase
MKNSCVSQEECILIDKEGDGMESSITIPVIELESWIQKALCVSGVPKGDAAIVAENLLSAELKGITTHGLIHFPVYLKRVRKGLVNPKPNITKVNTWPGVLVIDGDNGLGSVVMFRALNEGIEIAQKVGVCVIGVKHSNHYGISGYYCEKAADGGYISILFTNSTPTLPPYGAKEPYMGTNPIAIGIPNKERPHIIVDMATSVAARGKIREAVKKGEAIPEGWALDKDGNPTTDAEAAMQGVLLPIAGPKGAALSLAVEHLSGVLTGSGYGRGVIWQYGDSAEPSNVGHFLVLIRADGFLDYAEYEERTKTFISEVKSLSRAIGAENIKLPGERRWEREKAGIARGINIDVTIVEQFIRLGEEINIETEIFQK